VRAKKQRGKLRLGLDLLERIARRPVLEVALFGLCRLQAVSTTGFESGCRASSSLCKHKLQQKQRWWVEERGPRAS